MTKRLAAGETGNQNRATFRKSSVFIVKGEKFFRNPFLLKSWSLSWSVIYDKKAFFQLTVIYQAQTTWMEKTSKVLIGPLPDEILILHDDMRHQEKKFKRDLEMHCDYLKLEAGVSFDRGKKFFRHPFLKIDHSHVILHARALSPYIYKTIGPAQMVILKSFAVSKVYPRWAQDFTTVKWVRFEPAKRPIQSDEVAKTSHAIGRPSRRVKLIKTTDFF